MRNKPQLSAADSEDAVAGSTLNAKLFELSQRHRLKTTVFLVAAMATLTWGFTIQQTDKVKAEIVDDTQTIKLSQQ